MRIHRLELTNVRGIEHLVLDELPETGVVVIHGAVSYTHLRAHET